MATLGYKDIYKKKQVWLDFNDKIKGKFYTNEYDADSLKSFNIKYEYKGVQVHLNESDTNPLTCKFSMESSKDVSFNISEEDYLDRWGKSLGFKKEVEIAHKEFDKKYFLKGNKSLITGLLTDQMIELIMDISITSIISEYFKKKKEIKVKINVHSANESMDDYLKVFAFTCMLMERLKDFTSI